MILDKKNFNFTSSRFYQLVTRMIRRAELSQTNYLYSSFSPIEPKSRYLSPFPAISKEIKRNICGVKRSSTRTLAVQLKHSCGVKPQWGQVLTCLVWDEPLINTVAAQCWLPCCVVAAQEELLLTVPAKLFS